MSTTLYDPIASLLGAWATELTVPAVLLRLFLSLFFSAVIGCERSGKRHSAGLRTFMLVSLSGTVAMLIDLAIPYGETRLFLLSAASILSAAKIGVNAILFSSRNQIKGLTTAVALWSTGILGVAVGVGLYTMTLCVFVCLLIMLSLFPRLEEYLKNRSNHFEIHLELNGASALQNFVTTLRRLGMRVDDIELNPAYAGSGLSVYSVSLSVSGEELKKYKTHAEIIAALATLPYVSHIEEMR